MKTRRYFRGMHAFGVRKRHVENAILLAIAAAAQVEILVSDVHGRKWPLVLTMLAGTLPPLVLRGRLPLVAPLSSFVAFATASLFVGHELETLGVPALMVLSAGWLIGRNNERSRALVGLAVAVASMETLASSFEERLVLGDLIFFGIIAFGPWFAGQLVRSREVQAAALRELAARLEQERDQRARRAVADERLRIARELHDVVAHSISVMTIQAGAARLLLDREPDEAEVPLLQVEETGHQTLAEMRRLLGVLQPEAAPNGLEARPSLAHVESLVEQYRAAGLAVDLRVEGTSGELAKGVDLAAYRVVQEALTNVLRHAGSATATVTLRYGADDVELEVADDGRGAAGGDGGHGLVGMRERVALYGGAFEAGNRSGGGYVVRARIPPAGNGS